MMIFWASTESRIWGMLGAFIMAGVQISRDALTRTSWIKEQIHGHEYSRMNMTRLNGNFGSPNYTGLLMAVLIVMCLSFLRLRLPKARYVTVLKLAAAPLLGLFFYVFLKANSRGASLGLAASLFVYWLLQKKKLVSFLMLAVALTVGLALAPQDYFDRLKTITAYQDDASATSRLELWNIGLGLIHDHPMFGVGPDNFINYAFNSPHDAYIQAAAEYGMPAAILYCAIIISAFVSAIRTIHLCGRLPDGDDLRTTAVTITCMVTHITIQGFTTGFAHREFVYFFVALAYSVHLVAIKRTEEMAKVAPAPAAVLV
jgi:O-antigen ligase